MKKLRLNGINLPIKHDEKIILKAICKKSFLKPTDITEWTLVKKSIDARKKHDIKYVISADITVNDNVTVKGADEVKTLDYHIKTLKKPQIPPVIIGFGPAGMFCALILARAGLCPIVIERGSAVETRQKQVENFWTNRILNTESNVQFGEGGAGTFSDGKLNTGIKDKRIKKVLSEFVDAGAPEEILWEAKPHVGTDKLPTVVKNIRETIINLGGKVMFDTKMTDINIENDKIKSITAVSSNGEITLDCNELILAIGHSSRDTFKMLTNKKIAMEQKPFAVGLRIEHKAEMINKSQYGDFHDKLPTADYKLAMHLSNGKGVYTFCMCPGGYVVASSSEENSVVVNGMSEFARDGENSNSAVLVGVDSKDFGDDILDGMRFQEKLEKQAFVLGGSNYNAPCQRFEDFLAKKPSKTHGDISPSYKPDVSYCDLNKLFPESISSSIAMGITEANRKLNGFSNPDSLLTGVESRSSCPVRIIRNTTLESLNITGIYPIGEGAGYAGGITSAAVDGIKCAEFVIDKYSNC